MPSLRSYSLFIVGLFFFVFQAWQEGNIPSCQRQEKSDPLRKLEYSQFVLEGKYLIPPRAKAPAPPTLVARCQAGNSNFGHAHGKFLKGYLSVDAVLDFHAGGVPVSLRLDEGKVQSAHWTQSTDGSGAFFESVEFNNLLYGHMLPHKEGTNPPSVRSSSECPSIWAQRFRWNSRCLIQVTLRKHVGCSGTRSSREA